MDADDLSTPARLALRRRADGSLDDVVVRDVQMFRAEILDDGRLWLCCYLPGTAVDQDRIAFEVVARGDRIEFEVIETPAGVVSTEEAG
jgi:hypothetical protein